MNRILTSLAILLSIISCTNSILDDVQPQDYLAKDTYDLQTQELAKVINLAINNNPAFRNLIKDEVLKQFDGDYDLLMTTAFEKKISPSEDIITKSGNSESISVKEMLSYYCIATKSSKNLLDELEEKYPELQVSIPVHAEDWDPENYVPTIAIIPSDYEEFVTETVPGINANGEYVEVDAINPPEEPVIVIGLNERVSPRVVNPNPGETSPNAILTAQYGLNRIQVSIRFSNLPSSATVNNINLYRTGANSNTFSQIGNISLLNNIYYDWNIVENKQYSYYAIVYYTYNGTSSSVQSNLVTLSTINTVPFAVSDLRVTNEYATKNHIEWVNPTTNNFETQIYKTTPSVTLELIATLPSTQTEFYDEPVTPGEKWIYSVKKYNSNTEEVSLHQQKYIYNPYRNPSAKSKVMMKEIHIDESAESWLGGKPEVKINVYGQKLDANTGLIVVSELGFVDYQFTSNNNTTDTGLNSMLADWSFFDDSTYYPILNINMKEYDNLTGTMRFSMEAKCGYKYQDCIDLAVCGSITVDMNNDNKDCGTVYLRYYENPEQILTFANYNAYIRISEMDDLNP